MHADEWIVQIHQRLVSLVPAVPNAVFLTDEPNGDFGIAHYYGISYDDRVAYRGTTEDGIAHMSFDSGYQPAEQTVVHEFGHAIDDNTDGVPDAWRVGPVRRQFWAVRGLPGTPEDSDARARELANQGHQYDSWRHWAVEIFAECFAACYASYGDIERTQNYGVPLDKSKMRAFFEGLRSNITKEEDMDAEQVKTIIRQMLEAPEGALKVRAALTRSSQDNDGNTFIGEQLTETEQRTRRWIVGLG